MTLTSVLDTTPDRPPADGTGARDACDPARAADPHAPVRDLGDLVRHVEAIVPVAVRRQLWTLFFDDDDVPLPLMVPLEGIPEVPDTSALDHYGDALAAVATEFGAGTVAFVLERVGAASCGPSDRRWAEGLRRSVEDDRSRSDRSCCAATTACPCSTRAVERADAQHGVVSLRRPRAPSAWSTSSACPDPARGRRGATRRSRRVPGTCRRPVGPARRRSDSTG